MFMDVLKIRVLMVDLRENELGKSTSFIAILKERVSPFFLYLAVDHVGRGIGVSSLVGMPSIFDAD
jgi:hypothetical protein